jgi:uncharacterized protein
MLPLLASAGVQEPRRLALALRPDDVLATGNEWIALPEIRARDGALVSFNALFMRERGLVQVARVRRSESAGRAGTDPLQV